MKLKGFEVAKKRANNLEESKPNTPVRVADGCGDDDYAVCTRPKQRRRLEYKEDVTDCDSKNSLENSNVALTRKMNLIKVPCAVSGGDKICLFDTKTMTKLKDEIINVPLDAYEGTKLDVETFPPHIKMLACDNKGFKAGGCTAHQHAVRLHVHRKHCQHSDCSFYGCGSDNNDWQLFEDIPETSMVDKYEIYWKHRNRNAMRTQGLFLRMRASN